MTQLSADEIRRKIGLCRYWYHKIELAPGITTPGGHNSPKALENLDRIGFPADLTGKRVLDVGARDGFFSFAAERRGAEVVAVDYAEPSVTGFDIAAEILGSRVKYHVDNVYFLAPEKYGTFDIILFLGVIYHLRNPMLALDRLRRLCNANALFYVESQLMEDLQPDMPLWRIVPGRSLCGDGTNCWVPTLTGLKVAISESEFTVLSSSSEDLRGLVSARAHTDAETAMFRDLDSSMAMFQKELKREHS